MSTAVNDPSKDSSAAVAAITLAHEGKTRTYTAAQIAGTDPISTGPDVFLEASTWGDSDLIRDDGARFKSNGTVFYQISSPILPLSDDMYAYVKASGGDDTANIQAALDINKNVQLGVGSFSVSDELITTNSATSYPVVGNVGYSIKGCGSGSTVITLTVDNKSLFKKTASASKVNISAMHLVGFGKTSNTIGIDADHVGGSNFYDDLFIERFGVGLRTHDQTQVSFHSVFFYENGIGLQGGRASDGYSLISCKFQNNTTAIKVGYDCTARGIENGVNHTGHVPNLSKCWNMIGTVFGYNDLCFDITDVAFNVLNLFGSHVEGCKQLMLIGDIAEGGAGRGINIDGMTITSHVTPIGNAWIEMRNLSASQRFFINHVVAGSYGSMPGQFMHVGVNAAIEWNGNYVDSDIGVLRIEDGSGNFQDFNTINELEKVSSNKTQEIYADSAKIASRPLLQLTQKNAFGKEYFRIDRVQNNNGSVQAGLGLSIYDHNSSFCTVESAFRPVTPNSLPAASVTYRGAVVYQEGGGGVADRLVQCMKSAADTYSWVDVATG